MDKIGKRRGAKYRPPELDVGISLRIGAYRAEHHCAVALVHEARLVLIAIALKPLSCTFRVYKFPKPWIPPGAREAGSYGSVNRSVGNAKPLYKPGSTGWGVMDNNKLRLYNFWH